MIVKRVFNKIRKVIDSRLPTAKILCYHRIAIVENDPHSICVSPESFREQMKYLKENFSVIPLKQMVDNIKSGRIDKNSVSLTFDDGFVDNLVNALPILEEFNFPATVFVTSGKINQPIMYSWEEDLPGSDQSRPVTTEELKRLSASPLIEIGAHTVTHTRLYNLSRKEQEKEIVASKRDLASLLGKEVVSFAYPFGSPSDFTDYCVEVVKDNYTYGCACTPARITKKTNVFKLPRVTIKDRGRAEFKKQLNPLF